MTAIDVQIRAADVRSALGGEEHDLPHLLVVHTFDGLTGFVAHLAIRRELHDAAELADRFPHHSLLLEEDGALLGFALYYHNFSTWLGRAGIYLEDFFLRPPGKLAAWQARRKAIREQVLVATGLWPMPPRPPITPTVHGRIDRDGYSVEKVFFASMPGHYVTGSLYRPRGKDGKLLAGKLPGVLCPHGHWANGRFYDAGEYQDFAEIGFADLIKAWNAPERL